MLMPGALHRQRGVSLLEIMVGLSLGLLVVGAALLWLADQTRYARRLSGQGRLTLRVGNGGAQELNDAGTVHVTGFARGDFIQSE